jgi:hypothetical protein
VPILRAGLGMLDGVLDMIPNAKVSVVGLSRNHETLQPEHYFERFVGHLDERTALIVDPMLATAGSMIATVSLLKSRGCKDIRALVLVAAPEGIRALEAAHPGRALLDGGGRQPPQRGGLHHPGAGRRRRQDLRHQVRTTRPACAGLVGTHSLRSSAARRSVQVGGKHCCR